VQERGIEVVENEEDLKRRSGEEELGGYERKNPKIEIISHQLISQDFRDS
jgi:hypothetical protein